MEVHLLMVHGTVIEGTKSGIVGEKNGKKGRKVKENSEFGLLEFGSAREHIPVPPPL